MHYALDAIQSCTQLAQRALFWAYTYITADILRETFYRDYREWVTLKCKDG